MRSRSRLTSWNAKRKNVCFEHVLAGGNLRQMFARVLFCMLISAPGVFSAEQPPNVTLQVPPAFSTSVSLKHYQKGEDVLVSPPYRLTAAAPLTEYRGWFGEKNADQDHNHGWKVGVYGVASQKVILAYAKARDGYQADLNECPEFLNWGDTSYMFARFERKHFRWGDVVSFLSQSTQDSALYVPHNGHLRYEVWGVTYDHRFTVVAWIAVSHPKLAGWIAKEPELRDTRNLEALKKDPDYVLVETCRPDEFEPSLTAFDQLIDSLRID